MILQEHVEQVGVRLLDFIEQEDASADAVDAAVNRPPWFEPDKPGGGR